jgi:hypothetical protein
MNSISCPNDCTAQNPAAPNRRPDSSVRDRGASWNMRAGLSRLSIVGDLVHSTLCVSACAPELRSQPRICFCVSNSHSIKSARSSRADHPTRLTLVLLSRWFHWRDALTLVGPRTLIAWRRKGLPPLLTLEVRSWPATRYLRKYDREEFMKIERSPRNP